MLREAISFQKVEIHGNYQNTNRCYRHATLIKKIFLYQQSTYPFYVM